MSRWIPGVNLWVAEESRETHDKELTVGNDFEEPDTICMGHNFLLGEEEEYQKDSSKEGDDKESLQESFQDGQEEIHTEGLPLHLHEGEHIEDILLEEHEEHAGENSVEFEVRSMQDNSLQEQEEESLQDIDEQEKIYIKYLLPTRYKKEDIGDKSQDEHDAKHRDSSRKTCELIQGEDNPHEKYEEMLIKDEFGTGGEK